MTTEISPSFLKQEAKKLKKQLGISNCKALDEISKRHGYSNYKHYLNVSKNRARNVVKTLGFIIDAISKETDPSKKADLAIGFIENSHLPFHEQLDILKLFEGTRVFGYHPDFEWLDDVHFICEKVNLMKDELQSFMFNDFLTGQGSEEIHDYAPFHEITTLRLSNITYELRDDSIYADGNYNLTTKFLADEIPEKYKDYPQVQDRKLFGSFGIVINKNKEMTFEHSDMGEDNDGFIYGGSYR